MKRKELILLENRLRKLLKEETITDPDDTSIKIEVVPGVKLPSRSLSGRVFDWISEENLNGGSIQYNTTQRRKQGEDENSDSFKKPYDRGLVMYTNKNGVEMFLYSNLGSNNKPNPNNLGGVSFEWLDKFENQNDWNNYVKGINSKKAKTSSVGVTGVDKNTTTQIQQFISDNFKDYEKYLGTKPVDGYWGVKTDEAILRIIHDIEQKTKPQIKMTAANVEKAQSKTSKIG